MRGTKDDAIEKRLAALSTRKAAAPPPQSPKSKNAKTPRGAERKTTYRFGRIVTEDGAVAICILKDLSATGARVALDGEAALPPRVTLKIDQTAETRAARVAWQRGNEAGLDFV